MDQIVSLGEWVRHRRRVLDLTQADLARRVNCSISMLRKIERDERRPSSQLANLLAEQLSIEESQRPLFWQLARGQFSPYAPSPADVLLDHPATQETLGDQGLERERAAQHNLPLAATPFVGREEELAALAELLNDRQVRMISIVGPGGIGKTRLALEAAGRELHPQSPFRDGIFFVSLAPLEAASEIVSTLSAALNFSYRESGSETEQILNYVRRRQMLLIMDNFEKLLDGRDLLAEISSQAAGVKLLVTSRERLQLRGEQLFPLQGLALPEGEESVEESPAARLFLNICRRALPDFQLLEGDTEPLVRICQLVDGMPLGLELAASWAGVLPLSEIAAEIEQSLNVLSSEDHDVPSRHQSMQAALDVSWARLNEEQKWAFQELTIFRGGFTRAAALEISGASMPLLVTLMNKSWLSYDRQKDRYQIHELLRQYGIAKLSADLIHVQGMQDRHSVYYCSYLQEREAAWFGPKQVETAAEVRMEIENIQKAWHWAAARGQCALLAQGLRSLCSFYSWEGRKADGRSACRSAGEGLAAAISDDPVVQAQCLALWSLTLAWEANFLEEVAERERLLTQSEQVLERAAHLGWDTRAEQAMIHLGRAYATGNQARGMAIQESRRAQALFREAGDRRGMAETSRVMGVNYLFLGAFDKAKGYLRENLAISEEEEDKRSIAETTSDLGLVAQHQGQYEEAEALHRQALSLYRNLQNRHQEGYTLIVLSFTQSWAGSFTAAGESARLSVEIQREISDVPELWGLIAVCLSALHLGNYAEASFMAVEALELAIQRGHALEKAFALMFLGDIAFVDGDLMTTADYLAQSAALMAEVRYVYQALPRANLCFVSRAQGDHEKAYEQLVRALRSSMEYRSTTPIMYCLPGAALLSADDGNNERAMELYGLAQQFGHIVSSRWFEDVACRELEGVRESLPADLAAEAEARGREMDVWETAATLLGELDGRTHD